MKSYNGILTMKERWGGKKRIYLRYVCPKVDPTYGTLIGIWPNDFVLRQIPEDVQRRVRAGEEIPFTLEY